MANGPESNDRRAVLQNALAALEQMQARLDAAERTRTEPIAVVGMACRFPGGADTPEKFWTLLRDGVDAVTEVPPDRWDVREYLDADPDAPGKVYTASAGLVTDLDQFDPLFFGMAPREAVTLDPQQRLLLEVSWEALERSGQAPARLKDSRTGVFVGIGSADYGQLLARSGEIDTYSGSGAGLSFAAGRLSYTLGLRGPSMSVDTACSSALVAVHLAAQSLRNGECSMALAGGVHVTLTPETWIYLSRVRALAPDGRCKAFDAAADGFVRGEGCGIVVLKRLSDAVKDGDEILALIRGSAVNQDGASGGLTVPNGVAQQALIEEALERGGIAPADVSYVEAHGTGTSLGDPIEVGALQRALGRGRTSSDPLVVGSVKTNIGHLEAAAGIAGLMKVILAMRHGQIPGNLHFQRLNPAISDRPLLISVPTALVPWSAGKKRVAGVSAFGLSGTNAHLIVEAPPPPAARTSSVERPVHILAVSAKTPAALTALAQRYVAAIDEGDVPEVADLAFTANVGRSHFEERLAVRAKTHEALRAGLIAAVEGREAPGVVRGTVSAASAKIAFAFTGQGSQYAGMGRALYATQPTFRKAIDRCAAILKEELAHPLVDVLYPAEGVPSPIDETRYAQPALFAIDYALAELWRSFGIQPAVVFGHSVGEYVAACIAGVFSLDDALRLVAARGRLMQALPAGGTMAAVGASEATVRGAIAAAPAVAIAAVNGPAQVVISGPQVDVARVVATFETAGVLAQTLTTSHAFHSALLEPMLDAFEAVARTVTYHAPQLPVIANVTGQRATGDELVTAAYWRRHARGTVQWAASLQTLEASGCGAVVEVGPTATLTALAQSQTTLAWRPSLRRGRDEWATLLEAVAQLYVTGASIDWAGFDRDYARRKVALPTYPFQRERYWPVLTNQVAGNVPLRTQQRDVASWVYEVTWQAQAAPATGNDVTAHGLWVVCSERTELAEALRHRIERHGGECVFVRAGNRYEALPDGSTRLRPAVFEDFERFYGDRLVRGTLPLRGIVYLWALDASTEPLDVMGAQPAACAGVLHLAQLMVRHELNDCRLVVVTRGANAVGDVSTPVAVEQAPVWGLCRVVSFEHPELRCVRIDLDAMSSPDEIDTLWHEVGSPGGEDQIAFRGESRFVTRLVAKALASAGNQSAVTSEWEVRADRSYLITGGFGGLGLTLARDLVARGARHLALVSRRTPTGAAQAVVDELTASGAHVSAFQYDISIAEDVRALLLAIRSQLPPLAGVFHLAGTLDDGALLEQTWDRFQNVLRPKVAGAWHLHQQTSDLSLDAFVLFSSVTSITGNAGQSSYAAANAFLDALAHLRRSHGLPALSVNWGPWSDVGMAANLGRHVDQRNRKFGIGSISGTDGMEVLNRLLQEDRTQAAVLPIDWLKFIDACDGNVPSFLSEFAVAGVLPSTGPQPRGREPEFLQLLSAATLEDRGRVVLEYTHAQIVKVLGLDASFPLRPHQGLHDLGLDSLMALDLRNRLQAGIGQSLPATLAFDCPTLETLSARLMDKVGATVKAAVPAIATAHTNEPIAIVGMGCRFPGGASSPGDFWTALRDGFDAVVEVPRDRWDIEAFYDPDAGAAGKMYTRRGAFLDRVDRFDPQFFGIAPREAVSLDPQQRLLLEVAWEALENAGVPPDGLLGTKTGVFVGICSSDYGHLQMMAGQAPDTYFGTGNAMSAAAGRLSYVLGLQGPSLSVDTACSSSLVAVHLACNSLRRGESRVALAGGVSVMLAPEITAHLCRAQMLSPEGQCKTFDAAADGYVRGEGCGIVVLKRLSDALADGDRVLAVIAGSAVNQDGRSSGLTVPNGPAQQALVRDALSDAGVDARDVQYIEAHGTGTPLGDPIEVQALGAVFGPERLSNDPLLIGSVKTNVGHLEAAAGIAGLLKVVLALQHAEIPRHLHLQTPNPNIPWAELPVEVVAANRSWPASASGRRIAGVSSFGFAGTNAHLVVESAPMLAAASADIDRPRHVLALSARSDSALIDLARRYDEQLRGDSSSIQDVCFTANAGRSHFDYRLAIVGATADELSSTLGAWAGGEGLQGKVVAGRFRAAIPPKIAFAFTGQGSQYAGMGRALYATQPTFRKAIDRCAAILKEELAHPLVDVLYPAEGVPSPIDETRYAQPALFAIDYALAELWRSFGIQPAVVFGHSVGEYVAACIAGVFSLDDALRLVAARGRLMQALPAGGTMAAVGASEATVRGAIAAAPAVAIAAVNGPAQVVISGPQVDVARVVATFETAGVLAQTLTTSHAFHSALLEPMLDAFEAVARTVTYHAPQLPVIANVTGQRATGDELVTAAYWRRHARGTVQWAASLQTLEASGCGAVVEVGPTATLTALAQSQTTLAWRPSLRRGRDEWATLLEAVAQLYVTGASIDWAGFDRDYARRKVALPTYPFQRERYWIEAPSTAVSAPVRSALSAFDPANWLYEIDWQPISQAPANVVNDASGLWLILGDRAHLPVCREIERLGGRCIFVRAGDRFERDADGAIRLDPATASDFERLYDEAIGTSGEALRGVIHAWSLERPVRESDEVEVDVSTCASVLHLAQMLLRREQTATGLCVLTSGAQPVAAFPVRPEQSPVWGLCRGLRSEHPELKCVSLDVDVLSSDAHTMWMLASLDTSNAEPEIALRDGQAYVARLVRSPIAGDAARVPGTSSVREDRSYLITGGYGALGLAIARSLVAQGARHLALMGRRGVAGAGEKALGQLAALGADVQVFAGDVAIDADVKRVVGEVAASMPPLAGVIHAAGTLDDGALLQQNWQRYERVLAPKVAGAVNLHRATIALPLDFFVAFSSVSSIFGSRGQSNYAAANAYLDALAHYRRAEGLPALTINWGPWSDSGMAAALGAQAVRQWRAQGIEVIAAAEGAAALEYLIPSDRSQVAVLAVDWAAFARALPAGAQYPLLSAFVDAPAAVAENGTTPELVALLQHARRDDRERIVFEYVLGRTRAVMGLPASQLLEPHQGLRDIGLDSLMAVELRNALQRGIGHPLPATLAFDFPTVEALTARLLDRLAAVDGKPSALPVGPVSVLEPIAANEPIAIVGVGCRFPGGASGPDAFWNLLREGFDAIGEIPADRWDIDAYYDADVEADGKMYTRRGGFLDRVDLFDAAFFGIAPREAASLDPQQRLLLEVSWEALEHAGRPPDRLLGTQTGVFVGISGNEYGVLQAHSGTPQDLYFATGNSPAATAGRLSYVLGLQGPSMAVDTACSSSLVAVHLAVQSLRSGECTMALAAGVNALLSPEVTITLCRAQMLSPAGACRTFDAAADGYVRGEGCGVVVLKRLSAAVRDGDRVMAVINGSAVNQDGRSSGLTAPNGPAQEQVVRRALANAGVAPNEVGYVEVHGTGTPLGDPVEVHALGGVFGEGRSAESPLLIGSVKTNIGHLEAAAGIAGLIKVALSLEHAEVPAHLHFTTPNPNIAWPEMPVRVSTGLQPWPGDTNARRIAGVSSFGFTGTNAHIVLESAPVQRAPAGERVGRPAKLLTLSAKHPDALRALAASYARHLAIDGAGLADFCYTANTGRATFRERAAVVGATSDEMRKALVAFSRGELSPSVVAGTVEQSLPPKVAFVFAGESSQRSIIERELLDAQAAFRNAMDACTAVPKNGLTDHSQVELFAVEYALAELWQSWGVRPSAVSGTGVCGYVAECIAGALSLEDALTLAAAHGSDRFAQVAAAVTRRSPRIPIIANLDKGQLPPGDGVPVILPIESGTADWVSLLTTAARLYAAGVQFDWVAFHGDSVNRIISLPTYQFQRKRYWIERDERSRGSDLPTESVGHPLLVRRLRSPALGKQIVFESTLRPEAFPYLNDHRVHGAIFAPAAVFVEMAWAAASACGMDVTKWRVEDLGVTEALAFSASDGMTVQVALTPAEDDRFNFQIMSAQRATGSTEEEWTTHAVGCLSARGATLAENVDLGKIRSRCHEVVEGSEYYAALSAGGIEIGANGRAISSFRRGTGETLGELALSADSALHTSGYFIHPAIFDACCHVAGAAFPVEDGSRMVIGLQQVELYEAVAGRVWVHATVDAPSAGGPETLCATARLFNEAGRAVAAVRSLVFKRVSETALTRVAMQSIGDWLYQVRWEPKPLTGASSNLLDATTTIDAAASQELNGADESMLAAWQSAIPHVEALSTAYAWQALARLGWSPAAGETVSVQGLAASLQVADRHRRLLARMLEMFEEDGALRRSGSQWTVLRRLVEQDQLDRRALDLSARYPELDPVVQLTARCGAQLAGVLRDTVDPLELLFPGGSAESVAQIYQRGLALMNRMVRAAIDAVSAHAGNGRTLRILEIGSGTGSTTDGIAPGLPVERVRYVFTDISPLLLDRASAKFHDLPFMEFRRLDIERDPVAQGFSPESFDVVIASNVLHATRRMDETLAHVKTLMAPGGVLMIVESVEPRRWTDITFGLTDGWWRFEDVDLRPSHPLLSRSQWLQILSSSGFRDATALPRIEGGENSHAHLLMIARAPSSTAPFVPIEMRLAQRWLVLSDSAGVGERLTAELRARGDDVQVVPASASAQEIRWWIRNAPRPFDRILHLWSLNAEGASHGKVETLESDQVLGCSSALTLIQALVDARATTPVWFITRGAQALAADGFDVTLPSVSQSPLWGLARVVALEHPEVWKGIIDLDPADADAAVAAVLDELNRNDGEDQIAVRRGRRYVARLVPQPRIPSHPVKIHADAAYLITGGTGGLGLRMARWLAEQGAGEIILTSRRGLPPETDPARERIRAALSAIEKHGTAVRVIACDVGDAHQMGGLSATLACSPLPVRGVIHAATAPGVSQLKDLSEPALLAMLRPKVSGTWLLHESTKSLALDFFVLFSSTTGLMGSAGLGHYAAANCFLDSFAYYRRSLGLPAVSISWGAWDEMRVTDDDRKKIEEGGLMAMSSSRVLGSLGPLLGVDLPHIAVARVEWSVLVPIYETRRRRPFFEALESKSAPRHAVRTPEGGGMIQTLEAARVADRRALLVETVRVEAGRVLGLPPEEVSVTQGLFDMGMDSLMSVNLKSRLESGIGRKLPSTLTFNFPTVAAIAGQLEKELTDLFPLPSVGIAPTPVPAQAELDDDLSEQELAALLAERLGR